MPTWFWIALAGTFALSVGVVTGHAVAEYHAVQHAKILTPHHMRGGFYFIVPEDEYCRLIRLQYDEDGARKTPSSRSPEPET